MTDKRDKVVRAARELRQTLPGMFEHMYCGQILHMGAYSTWMSHEQEVKFNTALHNIFDALVDLDREEE